MNIPKPEDLDKRDYKFIATKPDLDFNPLRNKMVIENSIKKYEAMRKKKLDQAREGIRERADALATWIKSIKGAQADNPVSKYFSRRMIAHLRGDDIRQKLLGNAIQRNTDHLYRKLNNAEKN
jgi:hypothetical protein